VPWEGRRDEGEGRSQGQFAQVLGWGEKLGVTTNENRPGGAVAGGGKSGRGCPVPKIMSLGKSGGRRLRGEGKM